MTARGPRHATFALGCVAAFCATWATASCTDLFHSTDFQDLCDRDAFAPGCAEDGGRPFHNDGSVPRHDARAADVAHPTLDASPDVQGDAASGDSAPSRVRDAGPDASPAPPPTDFCSWTSAEVATHAAHACLWLETCAGVEGANDFGTCYPAAILAYDCAANPSEPVGGRVHDYWDELWQAKSCEDVMNALGLPSTTSPTAGCLSANVIGTSTSGAVTAQSCVPFGQVCNAGACVVPGYAECSSGPPEFCDGKVFHKCVAGNDVGMDCTGFGAGQCAQFDDGGVAGCIPVDAAAPCTPSNAVSCVDGGSVVQRCTSGAVESVNCGVFQADTYPAGQTICQAGRAQTDLALACYAPAIVRSTCQSTPLDLVAHATAYGPLELSCADAGLGPCTDGGPSARCGAPLAH